jgi:hypothetical protein
LENYELSPRFPPAAAGFLHRFGRETNQGEVIVEYDGRFYHIKKFAELAGA